MRILGLELTRQYLTSRNDRSDLIPTPSTDGCRASRPAVDDRRRPVERLCKAEHLGQAVQWPASIVDGAGRLAELESSVECATPDTLADLDRLRREMGSCLDFTVPGAQAAMLARLERLRTEMVAVVAGRTSESSPTPSAGGTEEGDGPS